jgi:putative heme transporter
MSKIRLKPGSCWDRPIYQGRTRRTPSGPESQDLKFGIERLASYSWRLVAIGIVVGTVIGLVGRLLVVVIPLGLAILLTRALSPVARWLQRHRWRNTWAALVTLFGFIVLFFGILGAASARFAAQFGALRSTIDSGITDIESWLVDTDAFHLEQDEIDAFRETLSVSSSDFLSSNQGIVANSALTLGKVILGLFILLIVTFYLLKEGDAFWVKIRGWFSAQHQDVVQRSGQRAWDALGSYLRGAAVLGVFEATIIGATLGILRANLIVPVMAITLIAAFVPIAGATVAGVIAVLVALVTVGSTGAIVMAIVAFVLQQLDNDLLAPIIYGRALRIHALTILLGISAGGALFGVLGSVFAVPVLAVVLNVANEIRGADPTELEATQGAMG